MKIVTMLAAIAAISGSALAVDWSEVGDAGLLPSGAQIAAGNGTLSAITGALLPDGDEDVDMYRIFISDPANFSASTDNAGTALGDTTLYLFNLDGSGIVKNDDISGGNFLSTINSSLVASLPAGEYLIAISIFGTIAFDNAAPTLLIQSIFDPNLFTGQNPPRDGDVVLGWADVSGFTEAGTYRIEFTGASLIPAPSTGMGLAAAGLLAFRRRRA